MVRWRPLHTPLIPHRDDGDEFDDGGGGDLHDIYSVYKRDTRLR